MSRPSKRIRPREWRTNPITELIRLDLPAPFAPISSTVWPASTFRVTPSTALVPP